jgi:hypothetical protein
MHPQKPPLLYHGSVTQDIKALEPRHRYSPAGKIHYGAVYATPLPAFAVAHSFPWSSDEGIGLDVVGETVSISIPTKLRERLLQPISIYTVSSADFEFTTEESSGATWHSKVEVPVLEEVKYATVEEALKKYGATLEYI